MQLRSGISQVKKTLIWGLIFTISAILSLIIFVSLYATLKPLPNWTATLQACLELARGYGPYGGDSSYLSMFGGMAAFLAFFLLFTILASIMSAVSNSQLGKIKTLMFNNNSDLARRLVMEIDSCKTFATFSIFIPELLIWVAISKVNKINTTLMFS